MFSGSSGCSSRTLFFPGLSSSGCTEHARNTSHRHQKSEPKATVAEEEEEHHELGMEARTRKSLPSPERGAAERRASTRLWFRFFSLSPISLFTPDEPPCERSRRDSHNHGARAESPPEKGGDGGESEGEEDTVSRAYLTTSSGGGGGRRRRWGREEGSKSRRGATTARGGVRVFVLVSF